MAGEYLYGTYGYLADSVSAATADNSTVALYVGTAPINLIRGYADKGLVNKPIRLKNGYQAKNTIGYAANWDTYTLSEAVAAHFANSQGNQGPIYVINVLNPDTHKASTATSVTLNFVNGSASFESEDIILDTLALADMAEGTDYIVSYNFETHKVSIVSADPENPIEGAVAATYYDVDTSGITEADIIGTVSVNGEYTGLQAAALMYQTYGAIVNLFAAPKWSGIKSVYNALVAIATKLNGHWDGFVYADIPLSYVVEVEGEDPETVVVDTITKAVNYKKANNLNSERSKVFWPKATGTDGNIYNACSC